MAKIQNSKQIVSAPNQPVAATGGLSPIMKLALLLGVVALIAYCNTLANGFVLDDFIVMKRNSIVAKGFSGIPELFATPYHHGHSAIANDLYRPLALAMFAMEYQVFGGGPGGSHLMNILVFAGCVMLLFLFLNNLFEQRKTVMVFVAALLFALHPIHTEVVANIKSRDELLCFLFSFAALLTFMKYVQGGKLQHMLGGVLFVFLALLSKETAITLLAVVPLVFFFYNKVSRNRSIIITVGTVVITGIYLAIRFSVLAKYNANHSGVVSFIDNILVNAPSASVKLATAVSIMGSYIKLLFFPNPLICDYSYSSIPFVGFGNIGVIVSLLAYVAIAVLGIQRLVKQPKDLLAFGLLFFLITISLFSNIPFLIGAAKAERFVFFASGGFCIAIAWVIDKWIIKADRAEITVLKSGKVLAVLIPICLLYAGATIARNADWKDNNTLYAADVVKAPENSRLHYYLGTDLLIFEETGGMDMATKKDLANSGIAHLKTALAIYPQFSLVISELGTTYFNLKNYDSAAVYFEKALQQVATDTIAMHNLSAVYFFQQKYDQSVAVCKAAIAIDPGYIRGYRNMGSCYLKMAKYDSAIYALRTAIAMEPGSNSSYQNIAYSFKLSGNMDSARKYEAIARRRNPSFSLDASTMK